MHLLPIGPNCQVNGVLVTEKVELNQGVMIVIGMDNLFRFNHPQQASKLRIERDSVANSGSATPGGGSGVFSLGQMFEEKRKAEVARLETTRQKLVGLEQERADYALEQERRQKEQADLELKMKEMEEAIAARAAASEEATASAAAAQQLMEENAVQAAAHAAKLAEEKTALEEAKRLADEQAIAMRASHAEQQRLLQEEAEAARVLNAQLAQQREEDAAANAASDSVRFVLVISSDSTRPVHLADNVAHNASDTSARSTAACSRATNFSISRSFSSTKLVCAS